MKKRTAKVLAFVLALVMMFSLFPVQAFAAPANRGGVRAETGLAPKWDSLDDDWGDLWGRAFDRLIGWFRGGRTPIVLPMPAVSLVSEDVEGMLVTVDAPEGALPEGATMETVKVNNMDAVQAAVDNTDGVSGTVLAAVDITFRDKNGGVIQPGKEITVTIKSAEIDGRDDLSVVHLDLDADQLGENEVDAEPVTNAEFEANTVTFQADSFSVYAVIGDNSGENARVKVVFHRNDGTDAVMYVKNRDTLDEIKTIVYDPGCGAVAEGYLFAGWTTEQNYTLDTERKTVSQIREELAAMAITEGSEGPSTIDYYPIILKVWTITYFGESENVSLGSDVVLVTDTTTSAPYTVNMSFGTDGEHHFEGWHISDGMDKIDSATYGETTTTAFDENTLFVNGTELVITGDVKLSVFAPAGHWLVFNENGKGATYNAPQFLETNEVTAKPCADSDMLRNGYDFGGWYTTPECTGAPFVFGSTINTTTNLYAKWTPKTNAPYTVVIWKQNVSGTGYDFEESIPLTGTTGATINVVDQTGAVVSDVTSTGAARNTRNYKINGVEKAWVGFHAGHYDTNKTIAAEGNTVVNVYYDRNIVELRFWTFNATGGYTRDTGAYEQGVEYYGRFSYDSYYGGYQPSNSGNAYGRIYWYNNNWVYPGDYYDNYDEDGDYTIRYTGYRYVKAGSWQQQTSMTMRGLYGSSLSENGKTWPNTYQWWSEGYRGGSTGGTGTTFLDAFLPASTNMVVNYYGVTATGSYKIYFYKQNANGTYTQAMDVNASTTNFLLSDKYTGYKCAEYSLNGTTWKPVGELMQVVSSWDSTNSEWVYTVVDEGGDLYYDGDPDTPGFQPVKFTDNLYIRFNRLSYKIKYSDGMYFDGNGNVLDEDPVAQGFGETGLITYGANISAYGNPNDTEHYKVPTREGFVFEGWYADDACATKYVFTTMPQNNIQVYAKWRQIQYRVFLHPNVPSSDTSLDWGDKDKVDENGNPAPQAMCFRISYDGKVSAPEGLRNNFWMNGWYTDEGCTKLFNAELVKLNETTVTTAYDRETEYTDTFNKWGELIDPKVAKDSTNESNRFWITKKLDLYASWRAKLNGADGIGVVYDLNGGTGTVEDRLHYQDNSDAIAQGAPTGAPTGMQFLYWEIWTVQDSEELNSPYVQRTDMIVYPGGDFKVYKADAQMVSAGVDAQNKPLYTYTVKLVAKYGPKEVAKDTHIEWFRNWDENDTAETGLLHQDIGLQINEAVKIYTLDSAIPSRPNYRFLGWALKNEKNGEATIAYYPDLGENDLFLKWDAENDTYQAKNVSGEWVNVTHVAADEVLPYQALYAVWEPEVFYIYHSFTGKLEAVPMTSCNADGTFDLTAAVSGGTLYGGYYETFNGLKGVSADTMDAAKASAKTADDHMAAVEGAKLYTGDKAYVSGLTKWWVSPITNVKGSAIEPVAGNVYYPKEVPAKYLTSRIQYIFKWSQENKISDIYLLTVVDDKNYQQVGFELATDNTKIATLAGSFTFVQHETNQEITVKPADFNGVKRGFVGYANAGFEKMEDGFLNPDLAFTMTPYWITPDGETITGAARSFEHAGDKDTIVEVTNP